MFEQARILEVRMKTIDDLPKEEHRKIHVELHRNLDLLLADFVAHMLSKEPPLTRPIKVLLDWSYQQTIDPDE